jgi:G3E family GTPase
MTSAPDGRIRLTVLGGFLGSGKSTWLRHRLHEGALQGAHLIVNEIAETPVDQVLLRGSDSLSTLAGGCACCAGLGRLVALLREIADRRVSGVRVDRIVLETSGLADPAPIVAAIRDDPVLAHHVLVSEVIVTVDALHGLDQLATEPLGRAQAELADRLVVTKVDAANTAQLRATLATLRALNPTAALCGSVHGSPTALPDFGGVVPLSLPAPDEAAAAQPIAAVKLTLGSDVDWVAFAVWLSALLHARGGDVLRVKGVVRTPAGRLLLQAVRATVQSPEIRPDDRNDAGEVDTVVVIGRGFNQCALQQSLRHFAGLA